MATNRKKPTTETADDIMGDDPSISAADDPLAAEKAAAIAEIERKAEVQKRIDAQMALADKLGAEVDALRRRAREFPELRAVVTAAVQARRELTREAVRSALLKAADGAPLQLPALDAVGLLASTMGDKAIVDALMTPASVQSADNPGWDEFKFSIRHAATVDRHREAMGEISKLREEKDGPRTYTAVEALALYGGRG
jgi:hypothetical protein